MRLSVIERKTFDGKHIVDDGLHCGRALQVLRAEWVADPTKTRLNNPWHAPLVKVFEDGLNAPVMKYSDDSRDARKLYQAGRHQAETNKFQLTAVHECAACGTLALQATDNKTMAATKYLQQYLGGSSRSTALRWIYAADALTKCPEIMHQLEDALVG